jgi:nicotinamidase-related amidase
MTSNSCLTVTAHDANMRGFEIYIPEDCSCARNEKEHIQALTQLEAMAAADVRPSSLLKLPSLLQKALVSKRTDSQR